MTYKVALTGGIGSGKTTIAARFAELGAEVIDADLIARELVKPGSPVLGEIVDAFGPEVLDGRGRFDRHRMRARVFSEPAQRRRLESILHPRIRAELRNRSERSTAPYVVLVIPLLVETGQTDLADRVLLVDLPKELQIERAMARDGQSRDQIEAILSAQCDRAQRLAVADEVIDNSGTADTTLKRISELHQLYLGLRNRANE